MGNIRKTLPETDGQFRYKGKELFDLARKTNVIVDGIVAIGWRPVTPKTDKEKANRIDVDLAGRVVRAWNVRLLFFWQWSILFFILKLNISIYFVNSIVGPSGRSTGTIQVDIHQKVFFSSCE